MNKSIYEYDDYRKFTKTWILAQPKTGRGARARIANAIGCHSAYVTNVLSGSANFSLEQADKLSAFLHLNNEEKHFFLLLIQLGRSGSESLADYFKQQILEILEKRKSLQSRKGFDDQLAENFKVTYYSNWQYAAIHIVIAIPKYNSAEKIAAGLALPIAQVLSVIEDLCRAGIVIHSKSGLSLSEAGTHLGEDSKLIKLHHINWRMRAVASLDCRSPNEFHYSSVAAISEEAAKKIRGFLVENVEKIRSEVRSAKEECCYAYCMDFFKLDK